MWGFHFIFYKIFHFIFVLGVKNNKDFKISRFINILNEMFQIKETYIFIKHIASLNILV